MGATLVVGAKDWDAGAVEVPGDVGAGGTGWELSGARAATVGVVEVASGLVVVEEVVLVGLLGPFLPSFVGQVLDMCCLLPHVQHLPWRCFLSTS